MGMAGILVLVAFLAVASFAASDVASSTTVSSSLLVGWSPEDLQSESRIAALFERWAVAHGKSYLEQVKEKEARFVAFKENLQYIHAHSQRNLPYWLGLTKFADLTNAEFRATYTGTKVNPLRRLGGGRRKTAFRYADIEVPESIDWRTKGAVSSVKDQGSCGNISNSSFRVVILLPFEEITTTSL